MGIAKYVPALLPKLATDVSISPRRYDGDKVEVESCLNFVKLIRESNSWIVIDYNLVTTLRKGCRKVAGTKVELLSTEGWKKQRRR
jgi:hypothetical protein